MSTGLFRKLAETIRGVEMEYSGLAPALQKRLHHKGFTKSTMKSLVKSAEAIEVVIGTRARTIVETPPPLGTDGYRRFSRTTISRAGVLVGFCGA